MAKEFPDVTFDCTIKGETHVEPLIPDFSLGASRPPGAFGRISERDLLRMDGR